MKKLLLSLFIFLMPLNVWAYSDYIYLGGNTLGIDIACDGILIVGFYQVNGEYNKGIPKLKVGDYIKEVNGVKINNLNDLTREIEKYAEEGKVNITYARGGKIYQNELPLIFDNGVYKTGLYVKDSITGIGTLTYIDPGTNIYGALGHEIIDSNSKSLIEIKTGNIFKNYITSIEKSAVGHAGSKNAKYYFDTIYGNITKNTEHGIFGNYVKGLNNLQLIKVGSKDDIKIGKAYIYTVLEGETVSKYEIEITSIRENSDTKNIVFAITDEELLKKTGGVIQGMSGSPIVQNDMIVGVVTHVIVDNPLTGYGLFITKMLEEGES